MEIITTASASAPEASPRPGAAGRQDQLANKETFMQLLVAQIKNQDPLKPMDSVQFLTQLAQFSELEQLIGIREEMVSLRQRAEAGDAASEQKQEPLVRTGEFK